DQVRRRLPATRDPRPLGAAIPHTVMNTMAATAAIAVSAKDLSLTLNVPTVAGELAIARGAAAVRAGRIAACLAGGADEPPRLVLDTFREAGAGADVRGEGAGFVVLEPLDAARARGARILGEIVAEAWRALAVRPHGVGRATRSRAIAVALAGAGAEPAEIGLVYTSANGDGPREAWERALLDEALAPGPVVVVDDGSRDGSAEIARRAGAEVICHPRRRGKGAAIRTGIAAARERGASAVVTLDGDGQHSPSDLGLLLDAARARRRTIVVGGRLAEPEPDALPPGRPNAIPVAGFFV